MPATITLDHAPALPEELPEGALVAVGVRADHLADDAPGVAPELAAAAGFAGKAGQTMLAATDEGVRLLVGIGAPGEPGEFRKVGAAAGKAALKAPALVLDVLAHLEAPARPAAAEALAEGVLLGTYRYEAYQARPEGVRLEAATIVAKGGARVASAVRRGTEIAEAVSYTRDLVNTPGGELTPREFAKRVAAAGEASGLEVEVWEKAAIKKAKMGGLLGVNRGSEEDPRFVILRHRPEGRPKGRIAFVGKGVTFDAGGLSIKPPSSMESMKNDMGGAAAVVGAMLLVPLLAPRTEVTAYLPMTDNMLGGDAMRVGDVLTARNGKTMEVLNTDAEGRLILADALSVAVEEEPDAIIDAATLTGACMVALGDKMAGVMGNHDGLAERVLAAAERQGELAWRLPLPEHLRPTIDSDVADIRNIATKPYGGALTAGLFLREFVGDVPWVHIDLAGPAFASAPWDEVTKGGTGYGVRTLAEVAASWTKLPAST
ncbi:MAG: leucyl aminopeptidase [Acidimicrobiales bacterium]